MTFTATNRRLICKQQPYSSAGFFNSLHRILPLKVTVWFSRAVILEWIFECAWYIYMCLILRTGWNSISLPIRRSFRKIAVLDFVRVYCLLLPNLARTNFIPSYEIIQKCRSVRELIISLCVLLPGAERATQTGRLNWRVLLERWLERLLER